MATALRALPGRWAGPGRGRWIWGAALLLSVLLAALGVTRTFKRRARPEVVINGMAYVSGGTFRMGSTPEEVSAAWEACKALLPECRYTLFERELPVREVALSPFYMDVTEVTNEKFAAWLNIQSRLEVAMDREPEGERRWYPFVHDRGVRLVELLPPFSGLEHHEGTGGDRFSSLPGQAHKPVVHVTWDAADRYCRSHGRRLPTEAEWEFVARGAAQQRSSRGVEEPGCEAVVIERMAGHRCSYMGEGPADVGTATGDRSAEGIKDLAGNVEEWVLDEFREPYHLCGRSPCQDPGAKETRISAERVLRVVRGGSWQERTMSIRPAVRARQWSDLSWENLGFRCATDAP